MRRLLFALSAACALLVAAPAAKADWVLMITEDGWAYVYHDPSGGNDPPPPPPGPWRLMYQISGIWFGIY